MKFKHIKKSLLKQNLGKCNKVNSVDFVTEDLVKYFLEESCDSDSDENTDDVILEFSIEEKIESDDDSILLNVNEVRTTNM